MSESAADMVLVDTANGVTTITLNRPDRANAISPEGRERIIDLLREADADPDVRAVLIRSSGKHFCAGADVGRMASTMAQKRAVGSTMRTMLWGAQALVTAVLDCGKPVVAAVQGPAAGLGATLALASDLVVVSEAAWFSFPFTARGLSMDAGSAYLLPRRIGLQKAKELAFFGERLTAQDALGLGMVNRVVPADGFDAAVADYVERLAKGATTAIGLSKKLLNASLDSDRQGAFLAEAMGQEINSNTDDVREGIAAFGEKREVAFRGY